jgi:hypothetical protein
MKDSGEPQFARWFLFSSVYESWHGLSGWFDDDDPERAPRSSRPRRPDDASPTAKRARRE